MKEMHRQMPSVRRRTQSEACQKAASRTEIVREDRFTDTNWQALATFRTVKVSQLFGQSCRPATSRGDWGSLVRPAACVEMSLTEQKAFSYESPQGTAGWLRRVTGHLKPLRRSHASFKGAPESFLSRSTPVGSTTLCLLRQWQTAALHRWKAKRSPVNKCALHHER
jgi:hypothetical protein